MNNMKNTTGKKSEYSHNMATTTMTTHAQKKPSKIARLIAFLANLETGFPLSGA